MFRSPHRSLAILLALPFFVGACSRSGSNLAQPIAGLAAFGGIAADPARAWVCAADEVSGRLVLVNAEDGSLQNELPSLGGGVGAVLYQACGDTLFAAVSGLNRLIALDPVTLTKRATIKFPSAPYAMAQADGGRLAVVTGDGLLIFDPATLDSTTVLLTIENDALVTSDRNTRFVWAAESVAGATIVRRFDLANLGAAPIDNVATPLTGNVIALATDFGGGQLFVGTDVAPGVHILDSATLAVLGSVDVGDGLTGMALSSTGLRLFYSSIGPLVESVIVEPRFPGPVVSLPQPPRERGLCIATNNQDIAAWDDSGSLSTHGIHPFSIRAPAVLHQGEDGTLTLHGQPGAYYLLLLSAEPAALIIDSDASVDPRLLELSLALGFAVVVAGQLDANGEASFTDIVPADYPQNIDSVWQAAQTPSLIDPEYTLSNAIVIRFLGPDCP
ncbi:MAG: hypothetical protein EXS13_05070 [Planctomycetes bacterium]|nr:hypothetical protein [Planctomycetota bacterium]